MNVEIEPDEEPLWEKAGLEIIDFQQVFKGNLVTIYTTLSKQPDIAQMQSKVRDCVKSMSTWLLTSEHADDKNKFQIIVSWEKKIRNSSRQIVKVGGDISALKKLAENVDCVRFFNNWSLGIY